MNWDDLKLLLHFSKGKTLNNTAKALGTTISTVSRRVDRLNSTLQDNVICKRDKAWKLTPYGQKLVSAAQKLQYELDLIDADITDINSNIIHREISICAPNYLVDHYLIPNVVDFQHMHPDILLNFQSGDAISCNPLTRCDVSLMIDLPQSGRLLGRKLTQIQFGLFSFNPHQKENWIGVTSGHGFDDEIEKIQGYLGKGPSVTFGAIDAIKRAVDSTGLTGFGPNLLYPPCKGYEQIGYDYAKFSRDLWVLYHETAKFDRAVQSTVYWIKKIFENSNQKIQIRNQPQLMDQL